MYIDFKVSYLERINVPDGYEEEVMDDIKSGKINSSNDACALYGDLLNNEYELLYDTSEQLSPTDNGGSSTIEIYSTDNKTMDHLI